MIGKIYVNERSSVEMQFFYWINRGQIRGAPAQYVIEHTATPDYIIRDICFKHKGKWWGDLARDKFHERQRQRKNNSTCKTVKQKEILEINSEVDSCKNIKNQTIDDLITDKDNEVIIIQFPRNI